MAVARKLQEYDYERYYSKSDRAKMDDADFAGPHRSFPILTQADVHNAARLIGHAQDPQSVKRRIIAIAKRKGFTLPDAWKSEEDKKPKESIAASSAQKLATITTCFLEDDAISLNGRQYPREAVDKLIASAQAQLADPYALPLTCFISHEKADKDESRDLVGRVTKVWREGTKAYAAIDIPNTQAGRDMATLVDGGYIRSQSLRASGAQMKIERGRSLPQVSGPDLRLEGIDFTTMPGLSQVARITNMVLAESANTPAMVTEVFHTSSLLCEEHMKEEYIHPLVTGDSPSMDGSPRGDYPYPVPAVQDLANITPMSNQTDEAHRAVHDHLANVLDACLAPMHGKSQEAARKAAGLSIEEAGRKLAMAHARHLAAAHDLAAHHAAMSCEGAYEAHLGNDGMADGDDDDTKESAKVQKEKRNMTREEAARLLAEAGYKVEAPKTEAQLLAERQEKQEQFTAAIAAQIEEIKKLLSESARPVVVQRRSLVEGATVQETPKRPYYRNGDYLREQMKTVNREELLDRSRPLPEWMDPERALREFQLELLGMYDAQFGLQ